MIRTVLLVLLSSILVTGCASNPYNQFYNEEVNTQVHANNLTLLGKKEDPYIQQVAYSDINAVRDQYLSEAYVQVGYSSFYGDDFDYSYAKSQAKKIGATVVIVAKEYKDTTQSQGVLVLPDYQTTTVTGNVGGTNFNAFGTTNSTKTQTYTVNHRNFDQIGVFLAKLKKLPKLGVNWINLDNETRQMIGTNKGLRVVTIMNGTPAFDNDLLVGDIILSINGSKPSNIEQGNALVREIDKGEVAKFDVFRNGKVITKNIQF